MCTYHIPGLDKRGQYWEVLINIALSRFLKDLNKQRFMSNHKTTIAPKVKTSNGISQYEKLVATALDL
jgi:hypothetical protein